MAEFLTTAATSHELEKLIKRTKERLVLISPYLQINDKIKVLLEDKDRLKTVDMRLVYRECKLKPEEINWLQGLSFLRTSFCRDLHAKCYLNEEYCIITSMNLYEYSQVKNHEMGVLISKLEDKALYDAAYEEAQCIIRASEEIRFSVETVDKEVSTKTSKPKNKEAEPSAKTSKPKKMVLTSELAKNLGIEPRELTDQLVKLGYLEVKDDKKILTDKGKEAGGESGVNKQGYPYHLWPKNFRPEGVIQKTEKIAR